MAVVVSHRFHHLARPENIVCDQYRSAAQQRFASSVTHQHPVVVRVFALVAVDEHQIERASECRSDVERRTDVVSDLMPVRAAAEERGGDLLQLVVHLHEHAALLESGGHAEGRIPRKSAYFQDVAGP